MFCGVSLGGDVVFCISRFVNGSYCCRVCGWEWGGWEGGCFDFGYVGSFVFGYFLYLEGLSSYLFFV